MQTWQQRDSNSYTCVFGVGHTNGTCIYTVRLNWEETGSEKSKMAAYTLNAYISAPTLASNAIPTIDDLFYKTFQYYNNMKAIFNVSLLLIICRVWIGPTVKPDPEYIGA